VCRGTDPSPAALDAFVAQFERPGLGDEVRAAVAAAEPEESHARAGATPRKECFAAMTSVAVLTVAESLLAG